MEDIEIMFEGPWKDLSKLDKRHQDIKSKDPMYPKQVN